MAHKSLLSPGPFLLGLTMCIIGGVAFAAPFLVPAGQSAETMARIFEVAGMAGGALIGVGLVAMLIGLIRHRRQT